MAPSEDTLVQDSLERIRRRLLDLTRRNALLNYRRPKRSLEIVDERPTETFAALLGRQSFTLEPFVPEELDEDSPEFANGLVPSRPPKGLPEAHDAPEDRHLDDLLQTPHEPKELERRCKKLATAARTAIDETGANFLYLAIGFLEWFESDDSTDAMRAPLILVPVQIRKTFHDPDLDTFRYEVQYNEEDIETNLSLGEKLSQEFGLSLPEFEAESDPEAYFEAVQEIIAGRQRWSIRREMTVSLFSFSKILMYRDLDGSRWPADSGPAGHPILARVIGGADGSEAASAGLQLTEIYDVDQDPRAQEIHLVMDADSSQHATLVDALVEHKSLVVHGPPGTGKSQTITNLIAAALAAGKSVLFVAEKRAALEVVRRRLDGCGLGDFVLELHSHRTNKGQLHQDLTRRLQRSFSQPRALEQQAEALDTERRRLLQYSESARASCGPDLEPFFRVAWRAGRFRNETSVPRSVRCEVEGLSRQELQDRSHLLEETLGTWYEIPEADRSAWTGLDLHEALASDYEAILAALEDVSRSASALQAELDGAPGELDLDDLASARRTVAVGRFVANEPPPEIANEVWPRLLDSSAAEHLDRLHSWQRERQRLSPKTQPLEHAERRTDPEFLQTLARSCNGLQDDDLAGQTLADLEGLRRIWSQCEEAIGTLLDTAEDVKTILQATPIYLHDFERCLALARLFQELPAIVREDFESGWLRDDSAQVASTAADQASDLGRRIADLSELLHFDALPEAGRLRGLADRLEAVRARAFTRLRGEYRELRKTLRDLLATTKAMKSDRLPEALREAADLKEEIESFGTNRDLRTVFGSAFRGLSTDWEELISAIEWCGSVVKASGDTFLAQSLVSSSEAPPALLRIGARLSGPQAILKDRLPACRISDLEDSPLEVSKRLLNERGVQLGQALDLLVEARIPRSTTVGATAEAAFAQQRILEVESAARDDTALAALLGPYWADLDTVTEPIVRAAAWLRTMRLERAGGTLLSWLVDGGSPPKSAELVSLAESLAPSMDAVDRSLEQFEEWGALDVRVWVENDPERISPGTLRTHADACLGAKSSLNKWAEFCRRAAHLRTLGLAPFLQHTMEHSLAPTDASAGLQASAWESFARTTVNATPTLGSFSRAGHEDSIERFKRIDHDLHELRSRGIARAVSRRPVPRGIGSGRVRDYTELSLIKHELEKQRRHIPIRQLVRRSTSALQALKPCFMMSPMSVAQYLPPGQIEFDLLVMDEASQVKPEDALGPICRVKQVVVVGDPKQLPPTTFFDRIAEEEVPEDELVAAEESESVLEIAQRVFENRTLTWHYRSKHESLIAFSNSQFYQNQLLVFPSPGLDGANSGVRLHRVENGRYQRSTNRNEAQAVARAVAAHLIERPDESLGVATMNGDQRDLISEELERLQKDNAVLDDVLRRQDEAAEPFFIKNLENVQGDERETIFISTTYGPDVETDRVYQRFGPISGDKGWRRLNVLFTRARKRIEVFTSLRPDDLVIGEKASRGVVALRNYLEFAETGRIPELGVPDGRDPDSDFEVDVIQILRAHGYEAVPQVGVAGFYIDVGVKDRRGSGAYVIGIECDGATYHSAKSIRDRDRIRQEILEQKGWRIHRIWSTDWFKNRDAEVSRLINAVEAASPSA